MLLTGGVVLLLLAVVLFFVKRSEEEKLGYIAAIQTSNARDVVEAAKAMADRSGKKGAFRQLVEVKGVIKSENPLTSEVAKQKCVYYEMAVTRKTEETYEEKNSATNQMVRKTREKTCTVASNKQSVNFFVEDPTGKIMVDMKGADIDPIQVADKFELGEPVQTGQALTIGGFTFNLSGSSFTPLQQGHRTIGYNYTEKILPLERRVYVLGEATDSDGELVIKAPKEKGRFIVSLKSEEELMQSGSSAIQFMTVGMILCGLGGFGLIIYKFLA